MTDELKPVRKKKKTAIISCASCGGSVNPALVDTSYCSQTCRIHSESRAKRRVLLAQHVLPKEVIDVVLHPWKARKGHYRKKSVGGEFPFRHVQHREIEENGDDA